MSFNLMPPTLSSQQSDLGDDDLVKMIEASELNKHINIKYINI